ncbi:dihydrodipicolinate reductase [Actinomadura sp. 7K507]|uniref:NAD(P)H-dependent amine dehydrogenase family protein n=1 Tax=Actinomadura sp. 7K507 TaxID=2530365 RepID=UPI00104E0700|nr:dihydrodipicolinate reductase [Actinomadura sp. 7K507]TDC82307.1 dihydrodipicolinate reductase [Actinomadura sp. 7K507]
MSPARAFTSSTRPHRVVQWATGAIGRSVIRGVLDRDDMELAGAWVHTPAKAGVDAGVLAGRDPIGVTATGDAGDILDLDADCVIYAPSPAPDRFTELETVCRLLASGKNVISLNGFVYPQAHGPQYVNELEQACKRGGVSVHGSGISGGFMADLMPLMLARLSRRITHVYVREVSDFARHPSWQMVHHMLGFGKNEEAYLRALRPTRNAMRAVFSESLHLVAAGLGVDLDEIDVDVQHRLAGTDLTTAAGPVPRGTVAGARWTFSGLAAGRPVITLEVVHKADAARMGDEWGSPGYSLRVDGRPSLTLATDETWVSDAISAAAAHALNSVPVVCAAEPGIRTCLDLPMARGHMRI